MRSVGNKRCIKIGKKIGDGAQSEIFEGLFQRKKVAVKSSNRWSVGRMNEVEILRKLEHPNIIRIHFKDLQTNTLYIVLDLCKYNLKQYVEDRCDIALSEIEVLRQVTEGVDYLHNGLKHCTVHLYLRPANILFQYVNRDGIWRVKISGFCMCREFICGKATKEYPLSIRAADIFHLGAFFHFVLSDGEQPFIGYVSNSIAKGCGDDASLYEQAKLSFIKYFNSIKKHCKDRINISEVIAHHVFKGHNKEVEFLRAIDIFSLGEIFYYVLSDGKHPSTKDDASLCDLEGEYKHTASSLIGSMLKKRFEDRITISEVKAHHLFWDDNRAVEFLRKASNFLENRGGHKLLLEELENLSDKIFDGNWKDIMCEGKPEVKIVLEKRGAPNWKSVQDLMRKIRNWISHYDDRTTTKELKEEVGEMPSGFLRFFTSRFPNLMPLLYDSLKAKKEEKTLREFYIP